jgi:hypothetical protein
MTSLYLKNAITTTNNVLIINYVKSREREREREKERERERETNCFDISGNPKYRLTRGGEDKSVCERSRR